MADEFDELLDRALGSYSAGEPLAGLEGRVLVRVRGSRRRELHWSWMAAAVCLVIVVGGGWFITAPLRSHINQVAISQSGRSWTDAPLHSRAATSPWPAVPKVRREQRQEAVARRHKMQLTREEVLLARFVAADPEQAAKQFASLNEYVQRDVTVAPLAVEPIKIEEIER